MDNFKSGNNIKHYDTNTIITEKDKERYMKNRPEFVEMIQNRDYSDPLIKINHILPKNFLSSLNEKYNI